MDYLNTITPDVNFWAVELVRFTGDGMSAYETRTLIKPPKPTGSGRARIDEEKLLAQIEDRVYRETIRDLLDACRGLGLRLWWGSSGVSIRLLTPGLEGPLSVAWFFPPSVAGWMSLTDLTLGIAQIDAAATPSVASALKEYLAKAERLPRAEPTNAGGLDAFHVPAAAVVGLKAEIIALWGELVRSAGEA